MSQTIAAFSPVTAEQVIARCKVLNIRLIKPEFATWLADILTRNPSLIPPMKSDIIRWHEKFLETIKPIESEQEMLFGDPNPPKREPVDVPTVLGVDHG